MQCDWEYKDEVILWIHHNIKLRLLKENNAFQLHNLNSENEEVCEGQSFNSKRGNEN